MVMSSQLDREAMRALAEAGYMPISEYVTMYGDDRQVRPSRTKPRVVGSQRRSRRPDRQPNHTVDPRVLKRFTARKRRA